MALHSFSESDLSDGQIVTLGRASRRTFSLTYTKADGTSGTITDFGQTVDTSASFTFSVEVHNGEDNGSHVIAWVGDEYRQQGSRPRLQMAYMVWEHLLA